MKLNIIYLWFSTNSTIKQQQSALERSNDLNWLIPI